MEFVRRSLQGEEGGFSVCSGGRDCDSDAGAKPVEIQPLRDDGNGSDSDAVEPAPQYASVEGPKDERPGLEGSERPSLLKKLSVLSDAELAVFGSMSPGGSSRDLGAGDEKKKRARARASTNFRGKSMQEAMDEANRENATCQQCDESQVSFPTNLEGYFPVLDPYSSNRLVWDFSMLVLIMVITIVTPFELTFLEGAPWGKGFAGDDATGILFVFWLNRCSDACFLWDMVLAFQTSYFDGDRGEWETRKRAVATHYLKTWFLLDLLSLIPYGLLTDLNLGQAGFLRIIRLVRLMKLLRLVKQPRIMAKLKKYFTIPMKLQTLLKYFILLFVIIHWTACVLRLITSFTLGDCHPADDDDHKCPRTYLSTSRRWEAGRVWPQYASAVLWALGALSGEAYGDANSEETVLNVVVLLLGIVVMAFLVGELANILGNFDPVGNAFSTTVDGLNSFLIENNFPNILRLKLREYIILSEPIYREKYYMELMEAMSPGLKQAVAQHRLSDIVRRINFFSYAMRRGCGIVVHATVSVAPLEVPEPDDDGDAPPPRRAKIVAINKRGTLTLEYDGGETETRVSYERVVVGSVSSPTVNDEIQQLRTANFLFIKTRFITSFAMKLDSQLFMPYESIIDPHWSRIDGMYIIHTGKVAQFRRKRNIKWDIEVLNFGEALGEDIATLVVGSGRRRVRHYLAKAVNSVQTYRLDADDFLEIIRDENCKPLLKHVHVFGAWQIVRILVYAAGVTARRKGLTLRQFFLSFADFDEDAPPDDAATGGGGAPPAAAAPVYNRAWVERKLRDLDRLKAIGAIDDEERAAARKVALDRFALADDPNDPEFTSFLWNQAQSVAKAS